MLRKISIIILIVFLMNNCSVKQKKSDDSLRKVKKIASGKYPLENIKLIKKKFKAGVVTNKIKANLLRKILIGEWDNSFTTSVRFDGEVYRVIDNENDESPIMTSLGTSYETKDNAIVIIRDLIDSTYKVDYIVKSISFNRSYCDEDYCKYSFIIQFENNKRISHEMKEYYKYVYEDIGHISIAWYEYFNVKDRIDRD